MVLPKAIREAMGVFGRGSVILEVLAGKALISVAEPPRSLALIENAPSRGISGGVFYDAIHAETARKMGCSKIYTLNESHFRHVAPDLEVTPL
jgi:predicted nucleic acid-binding protein